MGSLSRNTWRLVLPLLPFLLIPLIGLPLLARAMNAYALGESEAGHLGYDIERMKKVAILLTTLAIGAAVALTGIIAFVGLVVPHPGALIDGSGSSLPVPGFNSAGRNSDTRSRYRFQDYRCTSGTA